MWRQKRWQGGPWCNGLACLNFIASTLQCPLVPLSLQKRTWIISPYSHWNHYKMTIFSILCLFPTLILISTWSLCSDWLHARVLHTYYKTLKICPKVIPIFFNVHLKLSLTSVSLKFEPHIKCNCDLWLFYDFFGKFYSNIANFSCQDL